ncbi:hypothetical protein [Paenibacillus periandrae]|uniref:hypothetical protein n=1 Tax=Paenibacillus periandrae TaxID=1761741 RepID=UPI001F09CAFA|nr:hypothetical protein [Paenibacillus periandrae]
MAMEIFRETEKYIVVDMGDLTDPNRKLIPDNMRWMRKSNSGTDLIQEVPSNVYAFLSFDHFRVELQKRDGIMYSHLKVR